MRNSVGATGSPLNAVNVDLGQISAEIEAAVTALGWCADKVDHAILVKSL